MQQHTGHAPFAVSPPQDAMQLHDAPRQERPLITAWWLWPTTLAGAAFWIWLARLILL